MAELRIADLIAQRPMSSAELAIATGTRERSLHRMLRAVAACGIFAEIENDILWSKLPKRMQATDQERNNLVKFGARRTGLSPRVARPSALDE